MRYQSQFQTETANLKRFYKNKDTPVKKYILLTEKYIEELECARPNEIIEELRYSELFRQLLSITQENYRPDHFDSYFGGLLQIFDIDFLEWIIDRSGELKRLLHWTEICQLNANYLMWKVIGDKELTIKEMWYYERT